MSLQFLVGHGAKDHQKQVLDKAQAWLAADDTREVFFIVPNYNKFEREQEILQQLKRRQASEQFSTIRAQVYSFHRLAWYFLQRTGLFSQPVVHEVGAAMIMRKVLTDCQKSLRVFPGEVNQTGFISQLLALYQEFKTGNVSLNDVLVQMNDQATRVADAKLKLQDLALIFERYEEELMARELQVEQPITMLTNYLNSEATLPQLSESLFIVRGYSNFSAQEQTLLMALMQQGHVYIDLYVEQPQAPVQPLALFHDAQVTYQSLKALADVLQVPVYFDEKPETLATVAPAFQEVETFWRDTQNQQKYQQQVAVDEFVQLWKVDNPEEELRQIAVEIRQLVERTQTLPVEERIRYRDIQLLTLNMSDYQPYVAAVFQEADIPFYIDEEKAMEQHPLVEFLQALFNVERYNYRLADIFRLLRTELYVPQEVCATYPEDWLAARDAFRQAVDLTENQALAHNFQGSFWTREADWRLMNRFFNEEIDGATAQLNAVTNHVRRAFRSAFVTFFESLSHVSTMKEAVKLLYQFLVAQGVEQQLIYWRNQDVEAGRLEQARNHEQAWSALVDLMDELVVIYGDEAFDLRLFNELITSGLANLTFGKIPTAIDQVKINRLDLARPLQAKVTFAIGLNDTVLPRKVENKTLLTTEERTLLNDVFTEGQYLADKVTESVWQEPHVMYSVLLSASEQLYLTYPANNDTQQNLKMSPYLTRMLTHLNIALQERHSLTLVSQPQQHLTTFRSLVRQINNLERQALETHQVVPTIWQQLKRQIQKSPFAPLADKVWASQTHLNVPISLTPEIAEALYGHDLYSSVSRLETFHQCQYQYFAQYGLRLQERDIYGLNPAVTGEFFHDTLDKFMKVLIQEKLTLTQLTPEQRQQLTERVLQEVFGELRYELLSSSARMNFIRYQLGQTIQRVTWALQRQSEKMQITPLQTEVLFGQIAGQAGVNGLTFPMKNGGQLHVRGKIDRVDSVNVDGQQWLSVVDYKSSQRDFDLTESYYGLALQLVTYLDVALQDAVQLVGTRDVKPAGAFYMHVQNPLLDGEKADEGERLKQFKYDGIIVDDVSLFQAYDESLDASQNSAVFPIRKDKNGALQKVSQSKNKFYTEEELDVLLAHNRRKLQESGEQILSGDVALNPTLKVQEQKRACQHCPFRSVCNFDVMLKENNYQKINTLSREEIMQRMREEGEQHD